ncbi:hypothetical protein CMV_021826 [Castanea mollissima]|uniref:Uncharacterized protein n=1 Tax=Castanea mollissima TaxID=60419 RepID=A0A8J4QNB5_9ROSI|nr:hypothetical protein CMV_021826 [Castanea mollissima]
MSPLLSLLFHQFQISDSIPSLSKLRNSDLYFLMALMGMETDSSSFPSSASSSAARGKYDVFLSFREKVKMWRAALTHVGNLAGWPLMNRPFSQVIKSIVRLIWHNLNNDAFSEVTKGLDIDKVLRKNKGTKAIQAMDIRASFARQQNRTTLDRNKAFFKVEVH